MSHLCRDDGTPTNSSEASTYLSVTVKNGEARIHNGSVHSRAAGATFRIRTVFNRMMISMNMDDIPGTTIYFDTIDENVELPLGGFE